MDDQLLCPLLSWGVWRSDCVLSIVKNTLCTFNDLHSSLYNEKILYYYINVSKTMIKELLIVSKYKNSNLATKSLKKKNTIVPTITQNNGTEGAC